MCNGDSTKEGRDWKPAERPNLQDQLMPPVDKPAPMAPDSRAPRPSLELVEPAPSRSGHFRWVICTLLLFGVTKNYMDRQVLGVLKNTLQHALGWNEIDYSNLVFAFQAAYAVGMVAVGRFVDRVGTRIGYGVSIVFWSVAAMAHSACTSILSFTLARAALGLGESAAFPASIKTVTEWFPQ